MDLLQFEASLDYTAKFQVSQEHTDYQRINSSLGLMRMSGFQSKGGESSQPRVAGTKGGRSCLLCTVPGEGRLVQQA